MFKKNIDYDYDLECAVLGIFILEPNSFGACHGTITEECFYDERNKLVFNELNDTWKEGMQIDLVIMQRRLYNRSILNIGSDNVAYYLMGLTMSVISSAHIK